MKTPKSINPIKVSVNGQTGYIERATYARAKLNGLREFGYPSLTIDEVQKQIDLVLSDGELSVIGMFMEDELAPEKELRANKTAP